MGRCGFPLLKVWELGFFCPQVLSKDSQLGAAVFQEHFPMPPSLCSNASVSPSLVFLLSMYTPLCTYTLKKCIYEKNWLPWVNGLVSVLAEALSIYPLLHSLDPLCWDDQRNRKPPVTSLIIFFGAVPVRSSRFLWSLSMSLLFLSTSWVWAWEKDCSSLHRSRLELTCQWWDCVCSGNVI